ncbi:MAG: CheR family methyltransferase [Gallionella sp.]
MHTNPVLTPSTARTRHQQHVVVMLDAACELAFCQLILERTGIVLQCHQLTNLRDTVSRGCERFAYRDAEQYLLALQQSFSLTPSLEYLIAGVTVGESYFFRDSDQTDLLRYQLLPEMIAAKRASGNRSLRIWSAGCSQGQEIYTVAILLRELIPDIDQWHIHLIGTDINSEVVAKAICGRYSEWSFRATPTPLLERWFTRVGAEYEIQPEIKRMVRFGYLNLTVDVYPSILSETNALDLILCRNVFIYLDQQAVKRSMAQYAHCLVARGVLMLGASDPIYGQQVDLELVQNERAGYFRKVDEFSLPLPIYQFPPVALPLEKFYAREKMPLKPAPPRVSLPEKRFKPIAVECKDMLDDEMLNIVRLLNAADWHEALVQVDVALQHGKASSNLWQIKAKVLANTGNLALALEACESSLQLDTVNKSTYFLMGLILAELDRLPEAAEAFRKTLYLDHAFLEAHYELGMLRVRAKDLSGAFKSLENAFRLAKKGDPEYKLHNAAGMTYGRFAQVLENEMEMLRGTKSASSR